MWPLIRARWCWRTRPGGRPVRRSSPPSPPPLVRTSLFGLSSSSITLSLPYLPDTNIFDFARNILFFFPLPWFDSTNYSQSPKLRPGVVRETESPVRLPRSSCVAAQRRPFVLWAWELCETFDYVVPPMDLWAGLFLMFRQPALVLIPLGGQTGMEGRWKSSIPRCQVLRRAVKSF